MSRATLALFGGAKAVPDTLPEFLPLDFRERAALLRSVRHTPLTTLYGGYDIDRFQDAFAERFGAKYGVAMSSCTSALHAAISTLGIGPGDEVIVPTYSFVASVSVVVQQGAIPVFCDIDPTTLGLDVSLCRKLIGPRTRAIIAVHINGMPMQIGALASLCRERGLPLIEDCAGALGAREDDRYVGTFGNIGCFSFNVHKILRTGEGGMALTEDQSLAETLKALRVNGLRAGSGANDVAMLGFNYTMAQPIAALGLAQLGRLDSLLRRRRRNAEQLRLALEGLPLTFLVPRRNVEVVDYMTSMLLPAELGRLRDAIIAALQAEGVPAGHGYGEPLYRIGYLSGFAVERTFPVTERLLPRLIFIDPAPYLTTSVISKIATGFWKVFDNVHVLIETN